MEEFVINPENISEIEIILLFLISFLSSCTHEYILKTTENRIFFKNINIWISTIISTIICLCINPFILDINPRLILLPPLIIGLSGMDLIKRLTTLKGISGLIKNVLDIKSGKVPNVDEEEKKQEIEKSKEEHIDPNIDFYITINDLCNQYLEIMNNTIDNYMHTKNEEEFIKKRELCKSNINFMKVFLKGYSAVPVTVAIKISEIYRKEIEIDNIYKDIEKREHTPTSK